MIVPQLSELKSRADVKITRKYISKHGKYEFVTTPVCVANMDSCGTIEMANIINPHGGLVAIHKFYSEEELIHLLRNHFFDFNFYTLGLNDFDKLQHVIDSVGDVPNLVCLDAPNGYIETFRKCVESLRKLCPNSFIMAGNVVTTTATVRIIEAGADCVKVGIGSGAKCVTSNVTGLGYPQLSATIECSSAAHKLDAYICSDGGIKEIGDINKALVGGADLVMCGSLFMGFEENDGEWDYRYKASWDCKPDPDKKFQEKYRLKVYGMSSKEAQEKYYGGQSHYRASEGSCEYVEYKGNVEPFFKEIMGGIRSCGTYIGAHSVKDFNKCGDFVIC
jgi:GMP reductase